MITDGQHDITCDADVQQLQPAQRLLARAAEAQEVAVFQVQQMACKCICHGMEWKAVKIASANRVPACVFRSSLICGTAAVSAEADH